VAQEGDVVWVTVAGDRLDEFEKHLTGGLGTEGGH
jgi:hypothetical protein